jgi:hypothetical protein
VSKFFTGCKALTRGFRRQVSGDRVEDKGWTVRMDASSLLAKIARALRRVSLETIMVGNAAAALHGAPVTTLDIDFMFRKTTTNMRKLKLFARELDAQILKPYYPVSPLYRVVNEDTGLQVDFM